MGRNESLSKLKEVLKQIDDVYNNSLWLLNSSGPKVVQCFAELLRLKTEVILLLGEDDDE